MRYLDTAKPRLFAHRGASGSLPENTLEAFEEGVASGADILELDVHATRDGVVVVIHDERLDRTTDRRGLVRETTLAALEAADAGFGFVDEQGGKPYVGRGLKIPRLEQVLTAFPAIPLNIEIKQADPPIERDVLELLDRYRSRDRVMLAAEHYPIMQRIRTAAPDVLTSFSSAEALDFYARVQEDDFSGYRAAGKALQVPHFHGEIEVVTRRFVDRAHEQGLEVHVWTINDEVEMRALAKLGVDGLMSDFPARLRAAIER